VNITGMLKSGKLQLEHAVLTGEKKIVENVETASLLRCYDVLGK
jgi:hypothetical protein